MVILSYAGCDFKLLAAFSKSSRAKDGLQPQCKQCAAAYFKANRATIIPRIRARMARVKTEVHQAVWDYLIAHPCVDCGESDPVVLEFDHVRGEKRDAVQELVGDGHSLRVVMAEIAKCDVRCANCHRRKTAAQLGWYREQNASLAQRTEQPASTRQVRGSNP